MNRKTSLIFLLFFILVITGIGQDRLKQLRSNVTEKKNGKEYYIHTVKRGQTLYMISKAYGVEVDDIIRENPEVKEGLKSDQKLWIPVAGSHETPKKQQKQPPAEEKPAPSLLPPPPAEESLPCGSAGGKATYNVALMLPLYLNEVSQIDIDEITRTGNMDAHPFQFIEFYEGFTMALDSLKHSGISVQLTVYDVTNDTLKTKKMLREPDLKKSDLIIGLLFNKPFRIVADFAQKNSIPLVNPLSERDQIVQGYTKVIKVQPSVAGQVAEIVTYLSETHPDGNFILLHDGFSQKEPADRLLSECQSAKLDVHSLPGYESMPELFSKEKENVVVSFTEKKSYLLELISKLNESRNDYHITLVGLPRWDKFEDIGIDYLVNLKACIIAPSFIDYDDPGIKKFVAAFQEKFKTDPDPLAFQGFDVAWCFLNALKTDGKSFEKCLPDLRVKLMQTDLRFTSSKGNGYVNQHWEIYTYEDYMMKRVVLK